MRDWQSQSHVRWYGKYPIVFVPKYRRRVIYGQLRRRSGRMIRELCQPQGVELVEGHAMPDHVPLCLSIPPK
jgi:REP-associated tyrosine transposase